MIICRMSNILSYWMQAVGKGQHLHAILSQLLAESVGIGIDLAKEGITAASKAYPGIIWSVADLAAMPFADGQIDTIINILSPANYCGI